MTNILAPDGTLSTIIPNYEDRPQQREMARAVASALDGDRALIVEAGTGTGKTLAYLVPALMSGKRVVVSTGTRTLQDQLARRDLPLLAELMPRPFIAVTLKGVSNYVCRRRLHSALVDTAVDDELGDVEVIRNWANDSPTGDRAELPVIADNAPIWSQVTATPETRLGSRCPFFEGCFVTRARRAAEKADLVLVNHHLFFADLSLRSAYPGAKVLPDYDAVVFDEAHLLEATITDHFGLAVSSAGVAQLVRDLRGSLTRDGALFERGSTSDRFIESVESTAAAFFDSVRLALASHISPDADRSELPAELLTTGEPRDAWFRFDTSLDEMVGHTSVTASRLGDPETAEALRSLGNRAQRLRDDLAIVAERDDDDYVYWGELKGRGVSLRASPVEVGEVVRKRLLDEVPATIMTSATLSSGGSFDYIRRRLGLLPELCDELSVDSPFDYTRQALLYLARDLPEPREPGFGAACCRRIEELLAITCGRAFVLFTSHRALRDASRRLRPRLSYPMLVQGEQSRAGLLDRFRSCPGSVLFATGSFWQGVDMPGDCLSHVIIDKLPFAPPTDPLTAARMRTIEDRGDSAFDSYQLPEAALSLKQGFGRLIRRRDDRGIVSLLDVRAVTRRYGSTFMSTLPGGVPRTSSIERVRRWWCDG